MQEQNLISQEKMVLEARRHLLVCGVQTVDGFNEQTLKLTVNGSKVTVVGDNIKITAFNKANGNLSAEGDFYEFKYSHKKMPMVKRIFK